MTTITLVQAARHDATRIHTMTARPMNVQVTGLAGGAIQFQCTNALPTLQGATSVDIAYDATVRGDPHQTVQVSSVQA